MEYRCTIIILLGLFSTLMTNAQQNVIGTIEHDGLTRDYRLRLPPQYEEGVSLPLVFNLHGNTSNAIQQEAYTNFNVVADAEGFIVCHPDGTDIPGGTGKTWNVNFPGSGNTTDDAGFLNALIDEFHAEYGIDLTRVYSTGMSNGGYMSYKMACDYPNRIAAIASVTGSMVPLEVANCDPMRAMPVMQIHGTNDPVVPYGGAAWTTDVETVVEWWVSNNNCMDGPAVTDIPDTNTGDGCTAELYEYTGCDESTRVEFYKITNGGHTWPNGLIDLPGSGNTNRDFTASEVIWEFFSQFQLPASVPTTDLGNEVELTLAPNPSNGIVRMDVDEVRIQSVSVYNLLGEQLLTKNWEQESLSYRLDISHLSPGTYMVQMGTDKGILTEKIVKY